MTSLKTTAALATATVAAFGSLTATASAETQTVTSGSTTIKLNKSTAKALESLGVSVAPTASAKLGGGGVKFPVKGKRIDPKTGAGTLTHTGGIRFKKGGMSLNLAQPTIRVSKNSRVSAKVAGARATVFTVDTSKAKITASSTRVKVKGLSVKLSKTGASALNAKFHVKAFKKGQTIGTASTNVKVNPMTLVKLKSGNTALTLDSATAQALTSLGVAVAPLAPAALSGGAVAFPITGGSLDSKSLGGTINHSGGLTLTAGSKVVTLKDFEIKTSGSPSLSADVGGTRVVIANLDLSKITPSVSATDVSVSGVKVTLSDAGAAALNSAFGTTALSSSTVLGTAVVSGKIS